ncbi:cathelicidin-related antimicrobial peptide Bf-CRAMP-like [Pantherophis guttatus]|uniref:Vipericidin n=1 Tax=Pantherophis guttatus TaxID=94885 RepID=A0A6P9AP78_PANGU|nr:cathelicidin-related antimicrobial peptide Bf-CRAMP-like [Pantherophis guttatus]
MQTSSARLLLMLGLALSITSRTAEGETPSDQDALSTAVELYNRNSGLDSAFRLLQVKSPPAGEPSNPDLQELELILKETTCPNSGDLNLDNCDFKEDGVSFLVLFLSKRPTGKKINNSTQNCLAQFCKNRRVKRKVRKFFRKLRKLLPGGGSTIAHINPIRRFRIA